MKLTVQRHSLLKGCDLITGLQNVPLLLHFNTTLLTAYLQQFVLPSTSCPAIENKSQGTPKGKTHNWKKWSTIITREGKKARIFRPGINNYD